MLQHDDLGNAIIVSCFNAMRLGQNGQFADKFISLENNFAFAWQFNWNFFLRIQIDNKSSLILVLTWHWTGNKESVMTEVKEGH